MSTTEPTTQAGKALLHDRPSMNPIELRRRILAIEREAVEAALSQRDAESATVVEALTDIVQHGGWPDGLYHRRAAVHLLH
jgi:hypothetical protein